MRLLLDPQGQDGGNGSATPTPIIYEHEGQKYNITELLSTKTEYEKHKDDLAELDNYKQDREALQTLQAGINRDPELVARVRKNVGLQIAGIPVEPIQPAPVASAQPVAQDGKTPKPTWSPEQVAEMEKVRQELGMVRSQVSSVVTVEGQRAFEADKSNFLTKHPEFKDKMDDFYKGGQALIQERANNLIRMGVEPNQAWGKAQSDVSSLSHEELMYQAPQLRKVYEDSLAQRLSGRTQFPEGIGTPAENLQTGQPGMTPEADQELVKSLQAAAGDKEKREAALVQWSRRTGRDPVELYGFAPNDARGLSVPARR